MPTTGRAPTGNLSAELTCFVGRGRELTELEALMARARLVTLTGVGGAGKTRLALRVAAQLEGEFGEGVWFVDLSDLHDPGMLAQEFEDPDVLAYLVGSTLKLRELGGGPPLQQLIEQLADRRMLLVLDNCEHLIPASSILARTLLLGCPELRILATSRDPLRVEGEMVFEVPTLSTPDPRGQPGLAELSAYESVALFVARAQAAVPAFQLTEENHVAVADLCHRLDGLPLAIELAAAQIRTMGPQQILDRLVDRFALLAGGSPGGPERQQTLRRCVDWSFDLCAKPEGILWTRLSVFAGGFELDAVEGVCADEVLPEVDLLDLVTGLVDKSILVRDDGWGSHDEVARYRMLETIRDYGQEKLCEAGEDAVLRRRHRDWHQRLVDRACAEWISDRQPYWMARLTREHPNLRAAIEFCLTESAEAEAALRLVVALPWNYWWAGGLFGEGRRWLDRALAQTTAPTTRRARALLVNSYLAFVRGEGVDGTRLLEVGEELARRLGADAELAYSAYLRGAGALFANDLPVAVETLDRARTTLSRAQDLDPDLYVNVLIMLGSAAGLVGDHERANACVQELRVILEPCPGCLYQSIAQWVGGQIAWLQGDLRQAAAQEMASLRLKRAWPTEDRYGIALCMETLAWITADQRLHQRAAILLGAVDTLWTHLGIPITAYLHFVGYHNTCERLLRDALGEDGFADAFRHGQALTCDDAIDYALDELRQLTSSP